MVVIVIAGVANANLFEGFVGSKKGTIDLEMTENDAESSYVMMGTHNDESVEDKVNVSKSEITLT